MRGRTGSGATSGAAKAQLPSAIRVQLRDATTDRTLSVSTATLVHADMPADCVLAEVIADCLNRPAQPGRNRRAPADRCRHASSQRSAPARGRNDGFIVVAVLWILAALATLATIFSMYVINTATAFAVHDERLQAEGAGARRDRAQPSISSCATPQAPPSRGSFRVPHRQCAT